MKDSKSYLGSRWVVKGEEEGEGREREEGGGREGVERKKRGETGDQPCAYLECIGKRYIT